LLESRKPVPTRKIAPFLFLKITRKIKELGCQKVLWTDRKHGFLNRWCKN